MKEKDFWIKGPILTEDKGKGETSKIEWKEIIDIRKGRYKDNLR